MLPLTADQIEFFHREGYLSIDALTTPEDVASLRESYDRIFAQQAGRDKGDQFDLAGTDEEGKAASLPQILGPAKYAPEMNDSLLLKNGRALVQQLFGPGATASIEHAILKPAKIGAATPWHQDAAYWGVDYDYNATISIWVPLQDTPVEMGCMQFVPGSHRTQEIWPHRHINDDPRIHGLELLPSELHRTVAGPGQGGAVACPLKAGGATIHGGYTLHYTSPNRSATPRRALILGGGLPATKRATPRDLPWQAESQTARDMRKLQAK